MERHISEHCIERKENFKENGAQMRGKQEQPGKFLVFIDESSWANIKVYWVKVVNGAQFDHSSESSSRIVHQTGSLCCQQASQEVNH